MFTTPILDEIHRLETARQQLWKATYRQRRKPEYRAALNAMSLKLSQLWDQHRREVSGTPLHLDYPQSIMRGLRPVETAIQFHMGELIDLQQERSIRFHEVWDNPSVGLSLKQVHLRRRVVLEWRESVISSQGVYSVMKRLPASPPAP